MRHSALIFLLVCCLAATSSATSTYMDPADETPIFKVSGFRDFTAYILTKTQAALNGTLDVRLKWVKNADEAHADLASYSCDLASMSYDDTLSMALQEGFRDIAAAWPVHGSISSLCGTIDVSQGLVYVGIDTDSGYARMLRQYLKRTLSPEDYAAIQWVYAGATNLRYEQLAAGTINATLLNPPFTSFLDASIPCQSMEQITGPYQGLVGNVHASALDPRSPKSKVIQQFLDCYKHATRETRYDREGAIAGISEFYSVSREVATNIWNSLWGVNGLDTSFCFKTIPLSVTESIFQSDTHITVPTRQWWVKDWGCDDDEHY